MIQVLPVIFGQEQVLKIRNGDKLTIEETNLYKKEFLFGSIEEKEAFIKGLYEAIGWIEFCIPEIEFQDT